jgi:fibrillarin-like pre-rRNA processing protein
MEADTAWAATGAVAEVEAMAAKGVRAAVPPAIATLAALAAAVVAAAALAAQRASREGTESALENDGIRWISVAGEKHAATLNLVPGDNVYGEKLVKYDGEEYRLWDPFRSKLAGSLKKGLKKMPIQNGTKVLYLGASTGTTVSHVSDIVGNSGIVFAVEPATRVARDLIENVASKRKNVVPVLEDARRPQSYFSVFGKVDVVYCDIAQPDQTDIAITNCNAYLKPGGVMLLLVKTQSIDVTRDPNAVIAQEAKKLEKAGFTIEQILKLEPFDKDHGMIYCVK